MTTFHSSMIHNSGNLLAAVDLETTGRRAGYHEPIQIAVVPLNSDLRPNTALRPFYTTIKPLYPERQEKRAGHVHGIDINELVLHAPHPDKVADLLVEWVEQLDLPFNKCLIPLAHNWAFESGFLKAWMGIDIAEQIFHSHARDAMLFAAALNDKAAFQGEPILFNFLGLAPLCKHFNIVNEKAHDALSDCFAEAEVYRALLLLEV